MASLGSLNTTNHSIVLGILEYQRECLHRIPHRQDPLVTVQEIARGLVLDIVEGEQWLPGRSLEDTVLKGIRSGNIGIKPFRPSLERTA